MQILTKMNDWEKACKEFLKGCSNVKPDSQEECEECLKAFCDHLRKLARQEKSETCWVLWWKYSDCSNNGIERVYMDKRRAVEDYNLVENDMGKTWQLDEIKIHK